MKISKNLNTVLTFLGPDYTMKVIDGEDCAYRDLKNGYDIEISGCNCKPYRMIIYVWDLSKPLIIEKTNTIRSLPDLKIKLNQLCNKWLGEPEQEAVDHKAIQAAIVEHIKKSGFASYPELQDIFSNAGFDYKGNMDITSSKNENTIFWLGWNKEAWDIMNQMECNETVEKRPASRLETLLSGGMLRLPLVTGNYQYKTPHWLPIVFVLKADRRKQIAK